MRISSLSYQSRQEQAPSILTHSPKTKRGPNMHSNTHSLTHAFVIQNIHIIHGIICLCWVRKLLLIVYFLSQRPNPNISSTALKALKYSTVLSLSTGARTVHDIEQRTPALECELLWGVERGETFWTTRRKFAHCVETGRGNNNN